MLRAPKVTAHNGRRISVPYLEGSVTHQDHTALPCEPGRPGAPCWGSPPQHPCVSDVVVTQIRSCITFVSPVLTSHRTAAANPQNPPTAQRRAELCPDCFLWQLILAARLPTKQRLLPLGTAILLQLLTLQPLLHQHGAAPPLLDCKALCLTACREGLCCSQ